MCEYVLIKFYSRCKFLFATYLLIPAIISGLHRMHQALDLSFYFRFKYSKGRPYSRHTIKLCRNHWTLPGKPAEHPGTTKRGTIAVLLRENLKVFIADINYLFFYFSLFKVGLHVVKNFF